MRKNIEGGGSSAGYLVLHFAISLAVALILNPVWKPEIPLHLPMLALGLSIGLLMVVMMILTSYSLNTGPAAITFAFQNGGCVFPTLILFAIFGNEYGFTISPGLIFGGLLVLIGLFWAAAKQKSAKSATPSWFFFASAMFLMQTFILTLFQWKCLLTQSNLPDHTLIPFSCTLFEEGWLMPGMFIAAALFQTVYFLAKEKRGLKRGEIGWGILGGIGNGASTYLLLQANMAASPQEKGVIFPFFAVAVILICNAWGQWLYREKVSWPANGVCSAGIFLAAFA